MERQQQSASLVFRSGTADDVPAVARLGFHSFPAVGASLPEREELLVSSPHGGIEALWVGEEGGRIVAACRLFRFRQWIGGQAIPILGLGTVTISVTDRRRGLAAKMCASAFQHGRNRGDAASALYPFRTSFYRKLGYGLAGEVQQYRIPPRTLPDHPARSGVSLVTTDEDRADLATVYDRWAPRQTGQLERGRASWGPVWQRDTRSGALYRNPAGQATGYVVFRYVTEPRRVNRVLDVEEIVWLDREARSGLHAWLGSLSDQWDHLLYRAHPEEGFPERLAELRYPFEGPPWHFWFPASTTLCGPMFRLLDLGQAWRLRTVRQGRPLRLALEVHDDHVEENGGRWDLVLEGRTVTVSNSRSENADVTLTLGIEPLSRIFIGALSVSAAVEAGLTQAAGSDTDIERLDGLLRLRRPWTFDRF
jgi:predicted acetyltransferase